MSLRPDAVITADPRCLLASSGRIVANSLKHHWTNLVDILPTGCGLCLDLGAGDGRFRQPVESKGWRWIGLDIVPAPGLSAVGDACNIPCATDTFDIIFTNQVLEHIPHPIEALKESLRVLKSGSYLFGSASFMEPFHDSYYGFSHWGIEQVLRDAGFDLVEIRPGTSVFVALAGGLLPDSIAGTVIGALAGRVTMGFLRWVGGSYVAARYGKRSPEWDQYKAFLVKAPLRFAGHIQFIARKPVNEKL